jgi:hypothetical protein
MIRKVISTLLYLITVFYCVKIILFFHNTYNPATIFSVAVFLISSVAYYVLVLLDGDFKTPKSGSIVDVKMKDGYIYSGYVISKLKLTSSDDYVCITYRDYYENDYPTPIVLTKKDIKSIKIVGEVPVK